MKGVFGLLKINLFLKTLFVKHTRKKVDIYTNTFSKPKFYIYNLY